MKKLFLAIFLTLLTTLKTYSLEELKDVGISKYAVLEVASDNAPLRAQNNENAKRISNLYKDTVLFADKQTDNYYRVELKEGQFAWINKKLVEVQAIIPEKRFDEIQKISFENEKNKNIIKITTPSISAYEIKENGMGLDFVFYDKHFNPLTSISNKIVSGFEIPQQISNELSIFYSQSKPLFGYDVVPFEKGYILSVKNPPKISKRRPLKNIKVVVDAGHGGVEKGACSFGLEEKTINLQISKKLQSALKKKGAKVYMTRKKDVQVPLYDRVDFAKEKNADILISIHQNSLPNPSQVNLRHGVGVYYYHNQSKPLAQKIQNNLLEATNFKDDKIHNASFALVRPTSQISVLVECGYIIHKEESDKLKDKSFQKVIAKAITKGVEEYLKENF